MRLLQRAAYAIANAETGYHTTCPQVGFAPDLISLGGATPRSPSPATACILDDTVSTGIKSGYKLFAAGFATEGAAENTEFVGSAAPNTFNHSGLRNYCIVSDGVLRVNPGACRPTSGRHGPDLSVDLCSSAIDGQVYSLKISGRTASDPKNVGNRPASAR